MLFFLKLAPYQPEHKFSLNLFNFGNSSSEVFGNLPPDSIPVNPASLAGFENNIIITGQSNIFNQAQLPYRHLGLIYKIPIIGKVGMSYESFSTEYSGVELSSENVLSLSKGRYLQKDNNPPEIKIKFFRNLINIKNINCYSNEGNIWRKSDIQFISKNELMISLKEKFKSERGRINCSLWEEGGKWRWLGIQYVIAEY